MLGKSSLSLYSGGARSAGKLDLGETIGSQQSGHFEDAMIVVTLGELRGGVVVDDEGHVGVELKSGSGDSGGDWSFDGLGDGCGLGRAGGEQENLPRFQDRADAHSDGATRALLARREEF